MNRLQLASATGLITSIVLSCCPASWLSAQNVEQDSTVTREVEIVAADVLVVDEIGGEGVYRLDGNVRLRQEKTFLRARRAIQYRDSDLIVFEGRVRIDDEGDTLWADRLDYRSNTKVAFGSGNVRWTDAEVTVTADSGRYDVDDRLATFSGNVWMRDSTSSMTSRRGEYSVEEKVAVFADSVRLDQEDLVLTADSVIHRRENGTTSANGSVRIFRSPDDEGVRVVLVAGKAESRRDSGVNRLWNDPQLIRIGSTDSTSDTLVVRAAVLTVTVTDSSESFQAGGGARMWRQDIASLSDSLSYSSGADSMSGAILLVGSPTLWSGDAQVTGDSISVGLENGSPEMLTAGPGAFVVFEDTTTGHMQQVKGRRLVATFRADSLERLVVEPQAEALYFGDDTTKAEPSAVRFRSSTITIYFRGGDIGRIVASTDVEGTIEKYEPKSPPSLSGFMWLGESRPDRGQMLTDELLRALAQWPGQTIPGEHGPRGRGTADP